MSELLPPEQTAQSPQALPNWELWGSAYQENAFGMQCHALRIGARPDEIEDLVQSAVIRAATAHSQPTGDNPETIRNHLFTQIHSAWVDGVRSRVARERREVVYGIAVEAVTANADDTSRTEERIAAAGITGDLADLLESLPESSRSALSLRIVFDLTQQEISQLLGVALGTVKDRQRTALAQLRPWLAYRRDRQNKEIANA